MPNPVHLIDDDDQIQRLLVDMGQWEAFLALRAEVQAAREALGVEIPEGAGVTWLKAMMVERPSGRRDVSLFIGYDGFADAVDNGYSLLVVRDSDRHRGTVQALLDSLAATMSHVTQAQLDPDVLPLYRGDIDWGIGPID